MKSPIQNKIYTILNLYSKNLSDTNNNSSNVIDSYSSYYTQTIPNRNSTLKNNSYTERGKFTQLKEWNDYEKKVNNTKRGGGVYNNLINTKFNKISNSSSIGNKKIKKKISNLTNNFCFSSPLSPTNSVSKMCKEIVPEDESFSLKSNFSQKTLSKKDEHDKELFRNKFSFCSKRKPYKRFYISDLNAIKGNFVKEKINWKEINSPEITLSQKEQLKINESNDLDAYGIFSNIDIPKKENKKRLKYAFKPF